MTNTPEVGPRVVVCRHDEMDEIHGSSSLTARGHSQLLADDLNPGSHLEVGDLNKRRICPFIGIGSGGATNGYALTLLMKTRKRRASVDHDTVGGLSPRTDGMSEYPVPTYPEPEWEGPMAQITEDQLDAAAFNLSVTLDRLMAREWLPKIGGHLSAVADQVALGNEWEEVRTRVVKGPRPTARCVDSGLDYLTHAGGLIKTKTGKKPGAKKTFRHHLALCRACGMREECLEIGLNETSGIWGGTFPHERRTR